MPIATRLALLLLVAGLGGCGDRDDAGSAGQCRVTPVQTIAVDPRQSFIMAKVRVNDAEVLGIADTGAEKSAVTGALVTRLGLLGDPLHGTLLSGVGGEGRPQNDALIEHFSLGGYDPGDGHYAVLSLPFGDDAATAPGALIGADVLSHFDLDIDIPHGRVVLYDVHHCAGNFLPWHEAYGSVPLEETWGGRLLTTVQVDGHDMHAMIDTGASNTALDSDAAERIGVTRQILAKDVGGEGFGAAGVNFRRAEHRFHELRVGTDRTADPELVVLDRSLREADMLLGFDFLRPRHVWISYRTHRLFIATATP
jgi:clan AA aspartic protease (TIGR02281 family)